MQFRVPQFIDIEDKIFGPFSFKQFIYLAGGAGIAFIVYKVAPLLIAIPIIIAVVGLALALTFARINGRPFVQALENFFTYLMKNKMYLWKKGPPGQEPHRSPLLNKERVPKAGEVSPKLSGSKLHELSWSLDILEMKKK